MRDPGKPDNSTVQTEATLFLGERQWLRTGFDLHVREPGFERRIPFCYAHMTLGRTQADKHNDIAVRAPELAPRQAMFKLVRDQIFFSNLDPAVDSFVNGEPCTFAQLQHGDEVRIGSVSVQLIQLTEAVAFLEGYTEPHRREHWTLDLARTLIGRNGKRDNQVELRDPTVSREHATIELSDSLFVLRPESDVAPTWVNAEVVRGMRVLQDEDLIQLGQQLLRFRTYRANPKPRLLAPCDATILFSDIWDYTRLTEDRPLEQTIGQINEMYRGLGKVIVDHQGTLMTYLGDAMMAMFGQADGNHITHAVNAVRAALAMGKRLTELNADWAQRGMPQLRLGIGIATGEVMVGDVGLTGHREFAAMGDTTNLAARIEKLTREYDKQILVSGPTVSHLGQLFEVNPLGSTEIRGRRNPVEVFEVVASL